MLLFLLLLYFLRDTDHTFSLSAEIMAGSKDPALINERLTLSGRVNMTQITAARSLEIKGHQGEQEDPALGLLAPGASEGGCAPTASP